MTTLHIHLDQLQIARTILHVIEDSELDCADWCGEAQVRLAHEIAHELAPFIEVRREAERAS